MKATESPAGWGPLKAARSAGSTGIASAPSYAGCVPSAAARTSGAPESRRMWPRSAGPASGGTGTTGTPASSPATTATTVSMTASACTATAGAPAIRPATAPAAPSNSS